MDYNLNLIKRHRKVTTWNRLDLKTLGFSLIKVDEADVNSSKLTH
jgi:hypothetical protein